MEAQKNCLHELKNNFQPLILKIYFTICSKAWLDQLHLFPANALFDFTALMLLAWWHPRCFLAIIFCQQHTFFAPQDLGNLLHSSLFPHCSLEKLTSEETQANKQKSLKHKGSAACWKCIGVEKQLCSCQLKLIQTIWLKMITRLCFVQKDLCLYNKGKPLAILK